VANLPWILFAVSAAIFRGDFLIGIEAALAFLAAFGFAPGGVLEGFLSDMVMMTKTVNSFLPFVFDPSQTDAMHDIFRWGMMLCQTKS
jgi:hypothetical protein